MKKSVNVSEGNNKIWLCVCAVVVVVVVVVVAVVVGFRKWKR